MTNCYTCGKEIYFDDNILSKYGKKIPLSKASGGKHRCKNKPFNKDTRRQWWYEQQWKAQKERERRQQEYQKEKQRGTMAKFEWSCRILGVSQNATEQEIKQAFRTLMLRYHPDRCHELNATEKTREIIDAYENCIRPS